MASRDVKATIKLSKCKSDIVLSMNKQPQSMTVISSTNRVVAYEGDQLKRFSDKIEWPSSNPGGLKAKASTKNLGHANGCTYCDVTNEIMVCDGGGSNKKRVRVFDANSFKHKRDIHLPKSVSALAYDRVTGEFYTAYGHSLSIYSYKNFMAGKSRKKNFNCKDFKRKHWQDIGGYNGILYRVVTASTGVNYIDAYRVSSGKYLGSIKLSMGEMESCAIDENHQLHVSTLNPRHLLHTNININSVFQGTNAAVNNNKKVSAGTGKRMSAPQAFVATAKKELGTRESGNNDNKYGKWYGMNHQPWCAIFVCWCAHETFGESWTKIFKKTGWAYDVGAGVVEKGGKWIKKASKGPTTHVGIIASVNSKGVATTVEGNAGDKVSSRNITVPKGTAPGDLIIFYNGRVGGIARPKWPDGSFFVGGMGMEGEVPEELTLKVSPEQLYSSAGWNYMEQKEKEESAADKFSKETTEAIRDYLGNISIANLSYNAIPDIKLDGLFSVKQDSKPKTKVYGNIKGSHLPSTISYVEAPYIKLTIGGVQIGTYRNGNYPNYVNNLSVRKTNGSMNEYTIGLTHQISPGDNPNYIDNLISANSYNKIKIEYGDSQSGVTFRDDNALLIDVKSNFDFFNNNINYTLTATSSSIASVIVTRNYPEVTDKPSTIINNMLYGTGELLSYFPGMQNKTFTSSNNLIPTTDKPVTIGAVDSITSFDYLKLLVSSMKPLDSKNNSTYFLDIKDSGSNGTYFQVKEVNPSTANSSSAFMYEVDINYPDENSLVYNFSVDEDFAWPLAYKYSGSFGTYNYHIDSNGRTSAYNSSSNLKNISSVTGVSVADQNWWRNVTEFPVRASLEIKGLSTYVLLLNYIKVNVYYFGKKRSSSGVYIVTGQEDSLSGNGFRTKLDLLRVAGDNQYINVDGRVIT